MKLFVQVWYTRVVVLRRSIITLVDTEELSRDNMPASSRKRNKGKDRKAKREESKRVLIYNTWHDWARGNMGKEVIQCNHGLETTIPETYPTPFQASLLYFV